MYIYIYIYIHTHICIHIYIYMHTHMYRCIYIMIIIITYIYIYILFFPPPGLNASHVAGRPMSEQTSSLLIGTLSLVYSGCHICHDTNILKRFFICLFNYIICLVVFDKFRLIFYLTIIDNVMYVVSLNICICALAADISH